MAFYTDERNDNNNRLPTACRIAGARYVNTLVAFALIEEAKQWDSQESIDAGNHVTEVLGSLLTDAEWATLDDRVFKATSKEILELSRDYLVELGLLESPEKPSVEPVPAEHRQ